MIFHFFFISFFLKYLRLFSSHQATEPPRFPGEFWERRWRSGESTAADSLQELILFVEYTSSVISSSIENWIFNVQRCLKMSKCEWEGRKVPLEPQETRRAISGTSSPNVNSLYLGSGRAF